MSKTITIFLFYYKYLYPLLLIAAVLTALAPIDKLLATEDHEEADSSPLEGVGNGQDSLS